MTSSATSRPDRTDRPGASRRVRRLGATAVSSCLLGLLATGGLVHAQDDTTTTTATTLPADPSATTTTAPDSSGSLDPSAPVAAPSSFSLPLFGVALTVDITTGPGGVIAGVALNPADSSMVATVNRPNKVAFVNSDGTAQVVVRANGGGQRVEARAGSLDAFVEQPGGWSGEIFPGVPASVAFQVTGDGGVPGIVVGEVTGPVESIGEVELSTENDDEGEQEQEAAVRIRFAQDGMRRTLTVKVEVETDDGETRAKVRISLSRLKTEPFAGATVGTEQVWTGLLCDGSTASVAYTVNADATLTLGAVSPEPERTKGEGNSVEVRFATGERVRLIVRPGEGGPAVKVNERIRCTDAPDPTLNVPVRDDDDQGDDDGDERSHDDHDGDGHGNGKGNGGDRRGGNGRRGGGDDSTSTSAPGTAAPVVPVDDSDDADDDSDDSDDDSDEPSGDDAGDDADD